MTARSLAAIALKVWGAILIVNALASLPSTAIVGALPPPVDAEAAIFRATQIGLMLNFAAQALLGVALIALADRIVRWFIPDQLPLRVDVYASELAVLGFAIVGLFVLIQGAEGIAASAYAVFTKPSWPASDRTYWYVWESQRQAIVKGLVQIAAGLTLMFGRKPLVNVWWRLRGGIAVQE